jgi:hypothetical protein
VSRSSAKLANSWHVELSRARWPRSVRCRRTAPGACTPCSIITTPRPFKSERIAFARTDEFKHTREVHVRLLKQGVDERKWEARRNSNVIQVSAVGRVGRNQQTRARLQAAERASRRQRRVESADFETGGATATPRCWPIMSSARGDLGNVSRQ